jgi:metal-sulfur cluster biosynthetic enzyme
MSEPSTAPPGGLPVGGGSDSPPPSFEACVTPEQVTRALRRVFDPELGMSIVDLGLVYRLEVRDGAVRVTMTLTAPGCPIHDVMPRWVREQVSAIPNVRDVEVEITFDPPWSPDRIHLR